MSARRLQANRLNAQKSTGPRTAAGKLAIARNALKHGILSRSLCLDDESPKEFAALVSDLETALHPVGALELALVEKIAAALWRQRRLVRAENATVERYRRAAAILSDVSSRIGRAWNAPELKASDLAPVEPATLAWCRAAMAEAAALDAATRSDWQAWATAAPVLYRELQKDAADNGQDAAGFLAEEFDGDPAGYLASVEKWCRNQTDKAARDAEIQPAVRAARDEQAIPTGNAAQTFGRYAEAVDRELYRALKALREAQAWRLETLEAVPLEAEAVAVESRPVLVAV